MTGLNYKKDKIIEIAIVITDGNLKNKINGPNLIIKCEKEILGLKFILRFNG
jgi:oligoribonuclease